MGMTKEEHTQKHKELHQALDELVADWIDHTDSLPSKNTVFDLIKWSGEQRISPLEKQ